MFTTAIGRRGQDRPEGWISGKALRLALVLGTLILLSVAVNTLTILADSNVRRQSSATRDLPVIADEGDRLA